MYNSVSAKQSIQNPKRYLSLKGALVINFFINLEVLTDGREYVRPRGRKL